MQCIKPRIEAGVVWKYLLAHIKLDLKSIQRVLGKSNDEVYLLMHYIMADIVNKHTMNVIGKTLALCFNINSPFSNFLIKYGIYWCFFLITIRESNYPSFTFYNNGRVKNLYEISTPNYVFVQKGFKIYISKILTRENGCTGLHHYIF